MGPLKGGTPAVLIMAMSANKVLYSTSLPRTVCFKLFFTDCTASIFIHTKLVSRTFILCLAHALMLVKTENEKRCLCMRLQCVTGCFYHYFKYVPKMNTHKWWHSTINHPPNPPAMWGWWLSVVPYTMEQHVAHRKVIQNNHIPLVHYMLPWKLDYQYPEPGV